MAQKSESWHQVMVFRWCAEQAAGGDERLRNIFSVPNGGMRDKITGARMKAEGARAGVPDICLAWPAHGKHGLYIELKKVGGTLSKEQEKWRERLLRAGYGHYVAYSCEDAIGVLKAYLGS